MARALRHAKEKTCSIVTSIWAWGFCFSLPPPTGPARPKRLIRANPSLAAGTTPASSFSRRSRTRPAPHRSRERTAMTAQANPSPTDGDDAIGLSRNGRLGALAAYLAAWCETCADYYEAAALYEELSALSDAELQRRGLSRATLARYVLYGLRRTVTQRVAHNLRRARARTCGCEPLPPPPGVVSGRAVICSGDIIRSPACSRGRVGHCSSLHPTSAAEAEIPGAL